jgi:hypothetical protein
LKKEEEEDEEEKGDGNKMIGLAMASRILQEQ